MNREAMLQQLTRTDHWDILIIGGGATGLGAAVDAASRGYHTLLIEKRISLTLLPAVLPNSFMAAYVTSNRAILNW